MARKQLIVVIEGTAALGFYWQTILTDYLEKVIRRFCGQDSAGQKQPDSNVELSVVMFNARGPHSACLVQRSGWTKDINVFLEWLSAMPFVGGGFDDVAIAEGLAEALMMLAPKGNQAQQNVDRQRHCILVAASNPFPLPTPVYRPQLQNVEQIDNVETQMNICLSNAVEVAKSFALCSISLSVVSPRQLIKLRAIYNAGKRNPQAADVPVDTVKNPHFHVLISEDFVEACAALSCPGMTNLSSTQSPAKVDATLVASVSGPASTSIPPANVSVTNGQPVSVGNDPPASVKIEPTTVASTGGPTFPQIPTVPCAASKSIASLQTSSPISASQEMISINESVPEMKPIVSGMTQPLRPVGSVAANVRILNDVAQARQTLAGGTSIGLRSMGGTPMLSNMISSGMTSSVSAAQTILSSGQSGGASVVGSVPFAGNVPVAQNSASASFTSASSNISATSNISMSQISDLQGGVSMFQTVASMSQGNMTDTKMVQSGKGMNQNMMSGIGASMPSGSGTMIPSPGMSQPTQQGMQALGVDNNAGINLPPSQQTSSALQSAQSKYVKVWEGSLSGLRQGQPVFISRLEGYRSASASETLAANWPPTLEIVHLITQDDVNKNNRQYVGKVDFLVFRALHQHGFLGLLQEKKLCGIIQLPSQTLLLSVSDKTCRLIGMLFPRDMIVFKPQGPGRSQLTSQEQVSSQGPKPSQEDLFSIDE